MLRGPVEVDQQVAAEHKIIGRFTRKKAGRQEVAGQQAHIAPHLAAQLETFRSLGKMTVAKAQVITAKGIAAIQGSLGALKAALLEAVIAHSAEALRREAEALRGKLH